MKQAVLSYYPVISNLFYDELGERLSPELRDIYPVSYTHLFAQWYPAHEAEFKEIAERYIAD